MPERSPTDALAAAIATGVGHDVRRLTVVHGGDKSAAYEVELEGGGRLFAKTHPDPPPGFFSTEAAGLAWLRAAAAVSVPEVVAVSDGDGGGPAFLVLEWISEGRVAPGSEADFGRSLAALHTAGAAAFGRTDRRTTGSLALPNDPCSSWSEFYGTRRLLPLARLAADRRSLPASVIAQLERLAGSVDRFDDGRPAARLHGDLWAGNRLVDARGRSWLIDPAAHGGHPEFDLAMMRLFGGFGGHCFAAYDEANPLAPGAAERVALHQVAPLVVHAIKFGGSYAGAAAAAIGRYV